MSRERRTMDLVLAVVLVLLVGGCGDGGDNAPTPDPLRRCSLAENTCEPQHYCDFPDGSCGRTPTLALVDGLCRSHCADCICTQIFDPVCGCDGQTFPSTCAARAAGQAIAHPGPCRCGERECSSGTACCNPLLGICVPPGGVCTSAFDHTPTG